MSNGNEGLRLVKKLQIFLQNFGGNSKLIIVLTLAWRNILARRRRTFIIGILVMLTTIVLVIGHSFIYTIHKNIRESFTEHFTSDIILRSGISNGDDNVNFISNRAPIPVLKDYSYIREYLQQHPHVKQFTPILHTDVEIVIADNIVSRSFLRGINPTNYFNIFPNSLSLHEGDFWQEGERGIVLSQGFQEAAKTLYNVDLQVGDTITLTSHNINTGQKITNVPIRGFAKFSKLLDGLDNISFADAYTVRYLIGATLYQSTYEVAEDDVSVTEDDLFSQTFITQASASGTSGAIDYNTILGDVSRREKYAALDSDAWHFLLIDIDDFSHKKKLQETIQQHLNQRTDSTEPWRLEDWSWGAGSHLSVVRIFQMVFNISLAIVLLATILIMMNVLVISINERITEIGVMRALGAGKTFVLYLIGAELLLITLIFALLGMIISTMILFFIQQQGIPADNFITIILFAANTFYPVITPLSFAIALVIVVSSVILAIAYPIYLALHISPKNAIDRNS